MGELYGKAEEPTRLGDAGRYLHLETAELVSIEGDPEVVNVGAVGWTVLAGITGYPPPSTGHKARHEQLGPW